jgi:hypothetical protein
LAKIDWWQKAAFSRCGNSLAESKSCCWQRWLWFLQMDWSTEIRGKAGEILIVDSWSPLLKKQKKFVRTLI